MPAVTASTGFTDNWTGPFILFIIIILLLQLHFDLQKNKRFSPLKQSVYVMFMVCLRLPLAQRKQSPSLERRLQETISDGWKQSWSDPQGKCWLSEIKGLYMTSLHRKEQILNHSGVKWGSSIFRISAYKMSENWILAEFTVNSAAILNLRLNLTCCKWQMEVQVYLRPLENTVETKDMLTVFQRGDCLIFKGTQADGAFFWICSLSSCSF